MQIDEYQIQTGQTAIYTDSAWQTIRDGSVADMADLLCLQYVALKLNGEAGEFAEHAGKAMRDDNGRITEERREAMIKELGDVLWYVSQAATELRVSLTQVAERNLEKLQARKDAGTLSGSGSDR